VSGDGWFITENGNAVQWSHVQALRAAEAGRHTPDGTWEFSWMVEAVLSGGQVLLICRFATEAEAVAWIASRPWAGPVVSEYADAVKRMEAG
jgi:hypothetical protein